MDKDPRRTDVMKAASGQAHADTYPSDKKCAIALKTTRETANRWKRNGGPVESFALYMENAPDRFRAQAHIISRRIQEDLERLTNAELIAEYHKTIKAEPHVEAEDRTLDVTPGIAWLDRAAASERDSAIDARKAAIERLFAVRRLTEQQVNEGAP